MDFTFDKEHEQFRDEINKFCITELEGKDKATAFNQSFVRKVAEKGWLGIDIPEKYGGLGKDAIHRVIFNEVMAYHQAPISLSLYGRSSMLFGKICLKYGSEDMKGKWLPQLASGRTVLGQAYTEPEAGTDMSRIQTRAVKQGDHYIVNGQKIFITTTHILPYEFLMARTGGNAPSEEGLSFFILNNRAAGVSFSPLMGLAGYRTNQVFLDNVTIPVENLVGEEGCAYQYYMENKPFYLNKELGATVGDLRQSLQSVKQYCRSTTIHGRPLADITSVRRRLAEFDTAIRVMRNMTYRMAWMESHQMDVLKIGTVVRIFTVETMLAYNNFTVSLLGRDGLLERGTQEAPLDGMMAWHYQYDGIEHFTRGSPSYTKSLLATHCLGMPE
jgi:alkylation response protein AidB-like acyl-CoA dehydrogenase